VLNTHITAVISQFLRFRLFHHRKKINRIVKIVVTSLNYCYFVVINPYRTNVENRVSS